MAQALAFLDVRFDPVSGDVVAGDRRCVLRPRTALVFACLARGARQLVTKEDLLEQAWPGLVVTENSLAQCVREIRRALGEERQAVLVTVAKRGYQLDADVAAVATAQAGGEPVAHLPGGKRRASVVVLPLESRDSDPDQDYFADALTEDLTTDIGRMLNAFVIARGTAQAYRNTTLDIREIGRQLRVRYAVQGSVRRRGANVAVNLALCDTASGIQFWTERFEDERRNLACLQNAMAGRLAQNLHLALMEAESARIGAAPDPDAHDLAMRAWSEWFTIHRESNNRARELAARALAIDEGCTLAWVVQANSHVVDIALRWTADVAASVDAAEASVQKALAMEPNHPTANTTLAAVLVYRRRFEAALAALEVQMSLNPNFSMAHSWRGLAHGFMGDPGLAIACFEQAIQLSPRDPRMSTYLGNLAVAHLHAGNDVQALLLGERAVQVPRPWARSHERLAAIYGASDMIEEAQAQVRALLASWPGYSIATHVAERVSDRPRFLEQHARYVDGLRKAGLPEH